MALREYRNMALEKKLLHPQDREIYDGIMEGMLELMTRSEYHQRRKKNYPLTSEEKEVIDTVIRYHGLFGLWPDKTSDFQLPIFCLDKEATEKLYAMIEEQEKKWKEGTQPKHDYNSDHCSLYRW